MDVNQVDSIRTCQERPSAMVELEAQMASLLSLHNATSDVNLSNTSTSTSRLGIDDVYTTPATDFVSVIKFHGQDSQSHHQWYVVILMKTLACMKLSVMPKGVLLDAAVKLTGTINLIHKGDINTST